MTTLADWAETKAYGDQNLTPQQIPVVQAQTEFSSNSHAFRIASLFSIFYLIVGMVLVYRYGVIMVDNGARVANALYTIASPGFHLAQIGFIWNPLPSLLEIPLVSLRSFWPALARDGLAGIFVSAVFGGISIFNIYKILAMFGVDGFYRTAITILFGLNPLIIFFAANGMTDVMLLATMLGVGYGVMRYLETKRVTNLVLASLWLVVGFGVRYEAGIYALVVGMAIIPLLSIPKRLERQKGVGILLVLELPIIYAVSVWVAANWIIMKNPLYFLTSNYGNTAQISTGEYNNPSVVSASGHFFSSLGFVLERMIIFPPLVVSLFVVSLWLIKHKLPKAVWVLLALGTAEPIVQVLLLSLKASAGWERFFIFYIPLGFLLSALVMIPLSSRWRVVGLVVLGISNLFTLALSSTNSFGYGVNTTIAVVAKGEHLHPYQRVDQVENYLSAHPNMTVLVDTFSGWSIVARSSNSQQFITSGNIDFHSILNHPLGRVEAILVPQPKGGNKLDAIDRKYPQLWAGKLSWTHLVLSVPGGSNWRLYKLYKHRS